MENYSQYNNRYNMQKVQLIENKIWNYSEAEIYEILMCMVIAIIVVIVVRY